MTYSENKRGTKIDICMLLHGNVTHDARVRKQARSLASHGWRVAVVCLNSPQNDLVPFEHLDGFEVHRINYPPLDDLRELPSILQAVISRAAAIYKFIETSFQKRNPSSFIFKFLKVFRQRVKKVVIAILRKNTLKKRIIKKLIDLDALVFHMHDFPALKQFFSSKSLATRPVIYDTHELFFDREPPDAPKKDNKALKRIEKDRLLEAKLARNSKQVVTVGHRIADVLVSRWSVKKPMVIRNMYDLRDSAPAQTVFEKSGGRAIVHSGNITFGRHVPELILALKYLPKNVRLFLMGKFNSYMHEAVFESIRSMGDEERVIIVPPVPVNSISSTLSQADIGASLITTTNSLSYRLSLPNKLFEYIAAGLPIFTSRGEEMADLVKEYNLGVTCDETNPKSIAAAVEQLLEEKNFAYHKKQVKIARNILNWENEEKKLIELYDQLLHK